MTEKIKFHLDENVTNAIAEGLRRRGIDVTTTPEQSLIGISDEAQLQFALSQNRVIFTQDTDFLRINQTGITHCGIVYCSQGHKSVGEIIKGLILIWELLEPSDMFGKVEFI
jgi:predicted nuclease of predicted toxin-antitoxin system